MPRSSGVYSRVSGTPYVYDTDIDEVVVNSEMDDIATALTQSIARDGQTTITSNIPFNNNKITGLAAGTARTDAASLATIQDGTGVYVGTVGGTSDVITLTPSPAIASYVAGQCFSFIASGTNTTNATLNVSGLGAKAITKSGSVALAPGDIPSGDLVIATYDGTRFQIDVAGAAKGANSDITSLSGLTSIIPSNAGGMPVGSIITYAGEAAPTGYLNCDGSAVSRTTYSTLFAAIGTLWGTGDGSTTFNLPSIPAGETLLGGGTVGGSTTGQVQSHTHGVQQGLSATSVGGSVQGAGNGGAIQSSGPSTGTSTKNLAAGRYVLMCIKY